MLLVNSLENWCSKLSLFLAVMIPFTLESLKGQLTSYLNAVMCSVKFCWINLSNLKLLTLMFRGQEQWTQCDSCSKWRRLPVYVLLPPKWTCVDNAWDQTR